MARRRPPPNRYEVELFQPDTVANLSAALADFVACFAHDTDALSSSNGDRDRLVDLEWRLRLRAGETRPLQPKNLTYFRGIKHNDQAVGYAKRLLYGGPPDLANWSPPLPPEAAALSWFVEHFYRIDGIHGTRWQELAAEGPDPSPE